MAGEDKEFTHESLQDRETIVRYLLALAEGLQKGRLQLTSNGDGLALEPPPLVKLDLEAKQKRNRSQIILKMSWKRSKPTRTLHVEPLTISTTESPVSE